MGTFASDIVVTAVEPGRYLANLDHSWDLVSLPQGGIVASFALRAAAMEVGDPAMALRTSTSVFAGQVSAGELEIEVDVLRRGRSAVQLVSTVKNRGAAAGTTVICVFGAARRGPSFTDITAPDVPGPQESRQLRDEAPEDFQRYEIWPFWTRIESRFALGHAEWEDYVPESSDVATWLRFVDAPRLADGQLDPLALLTLADRMPGSIGEKTGRGGPRWFAPSADLTVHLLEPLQSEWVLAHDTARWADDGWASAESRLFDEQGVLVAYATQMMLFTYLED